MIVYSLVVLIVLVTMILNVSLTELIYYLTKGERQTTKSNELLSIIIKIVITQFANSAILYFVVSRILNDSFTSHVGLVLQISWFVAITGILTILYNIISPERLFKRCQKYFKYKNMDDDDSVDQFQI